MISHHYYETCPRCGANLDPGEICDCQKEEKLFALNQTNLQNERMLKNGSWSEAIGRLL